MGIIIREYRGKDRGFLVKCMNGLQDHVAAIDPVKLYKFTPDFKCEDYVDNLLDKVAKNKGIIFIAELDGKKAGCAAGIIKKATDVDLIDTVPFKSGRTIELFVNQLYRGKKIGSLLMERMEKYFKDKGCTMMELGCFATNTNAYKLYKKRGYIDRNIDLYKQAEPWRG